jgi:hypothetical protein
MGRVLFYVGGVVAGIAALMILREQMSAARRIPAAKAAAMLREAWADHHTTA